MEKDPPGGALGVVPPRVGWVAAPSNLSELPQGSLGWEESTTAAVGCSAPVSWGHRAEPRCFRSQRPLSPGAWALLLGPFLLYLQDGCSWQLSPPPRLFLCFGAFDSIFTQKEESSPV